MNDWGKGPAGVSRLWKQINKLSNEEQNLGELKHIIQNNIVIDGTDNKCI